MYLLVAGMVVFFGVHLFPIAATARSRLIGRIGLGAYKGFFSVVALLGLLLIVIGYRDAPFEPVYPPIDAARGLAHAVMPLAFILVAGANMKSNLKRFVRHPLSLGVLAWALVHLAANGDLASVLLFGGFAAFSVIDMLFISESPPPPPPRPRIKDLMLVLAGGVAFLAVMWLHGVLGPAVIG